MRLIEENAELERLVQENALKVSYCDCVLQAEGTVSITQIAKDYGYTAQQMNKLLHEKGIQYKLGNGWMPYKEYADKGYTQSKTVLKDGKYCCVYTCWTQKGRLFLYVELKKDGIVPLYERAEQQVTV